MLGVPSLFVSNLTALFWIESWNRRRIGSKSWIEGRSRFGGEDSFSPVDRKMSRDDVLYVGYVCMYVCIYMCVYIYIYTLLKNEPSCLVFQKGPS